MILKEQMNKYDVESSSYENANSDSEENIKDIKEKENESIDILTSNKKLMEKENKNVEIKKSIITEINNFDSKKSFIKTNELDINSEDRAVYNSRVFINIKKFNKNYDKRKKNNIQM